MCCYSNQLTIKCLQILRGLWENVGFPSYPINTAACPDDQDTGGDHDWFVNYLEIGSPAS